MLGPALPRDIAAGQESTKNDDEIEDHVLKMLPGLNAVTTQPGQLPDELSPNDASVFRALAARANYLAQDRPDIQFSVKEIARRMARPTSGDWALLKRLARYLVGSPRAVAHYAWQHQAPGFDTYVDSDWAGCRATARSTSGG